MSQARQPAATGSTLLARLRADAAARLGHDGDVLTQGGLQPRAFVRLRVDEDHRSRRALAAMTREQGWPRETGKTWPTLRLVAPVEREMSRCPNCSARLECE